MEMKYDEVEDVLVLRFTDEPLLKDISYGWNVLIAMTHSGIGQVTVLDAKQSGLLPIMVDPKLLPSIQAQYEKLAETPLHSL